MLLQHTILNITSIQTIILIIRIHSFKFISILRIGNKGNLVMAISKHLTQYHKKITFAHSFNNHLL